MRLRTLAALAAVGVALSACGLRGDLERPDPMWGSDGPDASSGERTAPPEDAPVPIESPD